MIIVEEPYVSELFIDTVMQNDWPVLDNKAVRDANLEDGALNIISQEKAVKYFEKIEYPIIYSNSENSINWILDNLPHSNLSRYIKLFKDKSLFRDMLKSIYPNFYYRQCSYDELKNIPLEELKFPLILKPAIGFLSLGVHKINDDKDWKASLFSLESEIKTASELYPETVVNTSKFIIEEFIEGDEYAIDAYYDKNGMPVILNIFKHPFLNSKDVSDRIYITSAKIMLKYMEHLTLLLKQIGDCNDIRNFPVHLEVRIKPDGEVIPIEANPMRFAGWCTTDVAKYAWGINVYEYYMNQLKPDWNKILSDINSTIYYFSMAEVPINIKKSKIKEFDYKKFLSNYSNILELRRIDPHKHPLFAVIFGSTNNLDEVKRILEIKTSDYIKFS